MDYLRTRIAKRRFPSCNAPSPRSAQVLSSPVSAFMDFAAPAHAAPQLSPLVSPAELAAFKRDADLLLLDIRQGEASEGVSVYEAGHIPGAVHAPYARWRGPAENPGQVLTDAELTELFRSLGVEEGRPVVVIHQGDSVSDFRRRCACLTGP